MYQPDKQNASLLGTTVEQASLTSDIDRNQLLLELEHDDIESDLQAHLIDLYFTWQNPWTPIVDEDLFRQSETLRSRYFSPLLLNCILAAGSRYSDRTEVRSDPQDTTSAGRLFLKKAERLLHYELRWPNLTTIQALSILVGVYVVSSDRTQGRRHE